LGRVVDVINLEAEDGGRCSDGADAKEVLLKYDMH
jgi:hypothetical protein